jgi:two-component system sensor histidine kinase KdpD
MVDIPAGQPPRRRTLAAPYALPSACGMLLLIGAVAAGTHGAVSAGWVLALAAAVTGITGVLAESTVTLFVALAAWLTSAGFSAPPYAQLHVTWSGGMRAALILAGCGLAGLAIGAGMRWFVSSFTLWVVDVSDADQFGEAQAQAQAWLGAAAPGSPAGSAAGGIAAPAAAAAATATAPQAADPGRGIWRRVLGRSGGIGGKRQLVGVLLVLLLPLLTAALLPASRSLSLPDDSLIFLVCVVGVAVVGGFWPAVLAAVTASLLLNWYFTPPVHTLTIANPKDMLALLLFVTVAVSVSSVVHLAARRAVQAKHAGQEAAALLALAQTVLGGSDTPAAILEHLTKTRGGRAELLERVSGQWVKVAAAGPVAGPQSAQARVRAGADLTLVVSGQREPITPRLLNGFAAQAAAALDRDRLRTQAAQAEALAEGNRMRTALLAAVSHDLRTPLASIKASVSTVRQPHVKLPAQDEEALLATIEQSADRLNGLIGNLLDMSRLSTGSLEPFLRPTSIDEVAPLAHAEPDAPLKVRLIVPDDLPLVRTDPGLLERVLANLFVNAVAHSPAGSPPVMVARQQGDLVFLEVIDHGRGVPDDSKPRMFEPFERLGERNAGTGVGLGLAVAKGFLLAMGGAIEAVDTPGGGLTVRVTLPVAAPATDSMLADQ